MRYLLIMAFSFIGLTYTIDSYGQSTEEIIGEGWEHIGTRKINKKLDRDEIPVTVADGNFKKLIIIAENKGIIIKQFIVEFTDESRQIVNVRKKLEAEEASPVIHMTGSGAHIVKGVLIVYEAKSKKGKVRLYGMR